MKSTSAKLLDVIALLKEEPGLQLAIGQVGTIVEILAPDVFEVEFCDVTGCTINFAQLQRHEFLILRHEAVLAA